MLVARGVTIALHIVKAPAHDHRQFIDISGLERRQPVLRHADQRGGDGLMGAAFRRQCNAGGRGHHHEAGILITGIIEGIEAAHDEGVIKRADGQQPLAINRMRQAQRRQQNEQIHFGNAEFDMLALGRKVPDKGRWNFLFAKQIRHRITRK